MYSSEFCRVYNEFGWNYFPEIFGEQLLEWLRRREIAVRSSLDIGCGTGVLCEILHGQGIQAFGMDLSEGMIAVARERNPEIEYEVANMVTYRPERQFDLVTCTGDALNHIIEPKDIRQIFRNVYAYLSEGGHFIFDLLNEDEVPDSEPFDMPYSDSVRAQLCVTRKPGGLIELKTRVYENDVLKVEECITETLHDREMICGMLRECGFEIRQCANRLLEDENPGTTWFIVAQKPEKKAEKLPD